MEIKVHARQGQSIKAIARDLGIARNTVRKAPRSEETPCYGPRAPRTTKLDPYKTYLGQRIETATDWIPATVLLREIRSRGYDGGITQLKEYLRLFKPQPVADPLVRFETPPGRQLQVDFVVLRRGPDRLSAFVSTLGFSRVTHVTFVTDEKIDTVIRGLREAFAAFEGVPHEVLFDNMKTVVLERDAYGPGRHRYTGALLDLAKSCGFRIRLCRPYRAKTKGKVERFNRYLRGSFYVPLKAQFAAVGLEPAKQSLAKDIVVDALLMAVWHRPTNSIIVHSDQGSQYGSDAWLRFCRAHRLTPSMSRRGNCWDNAVAESFFSSL